MMPPVPPGMFRPRSDAVAAGQQRMPGYHGRCGGIVLALEAEIMSGVPFVVCTICDNLPARDPYIDRTRFEE